MNSATGYSQANMWAHTTPMPGYSPSYHHPAGPTSQDPYGYRGLPTATSLTFPSPTAARSFTESGVSMFNTMGPQGLTPNKGSAYFAPRQEMNSGMYAPPQQRFGEAKGQATQHQPPLREAPGRGGRAECQEECAEEECLDSEQCGDEQRPPKPDQLCLGVIDTRPLLPVALTMSTICGLICMMLVQMPMLARLCNLSESTLYAITLPIYVITLSALAYSAITDPGQLHKEYVPPPPGAALMSGSNENTDGDEDAVDKGLPKRAHKCWQYKRPVRRYDHYCRWLTNVIGLTNHREFLIMVMGLVAIGLSGICLDVLLMVAMEREGKLFWVSAIFVILHLLYSIGLTGLAGPILKIHVGLVSRNEVAQEWKKNTNYIVRTCKQGENVDVNALSDDEFNALFDAFVYDRSKNPYDKGCVKNCGVFWCTPRWRKDELGEF